MELSNLREWWLASAGDAMLLFLLRMTTASLALIACTLAWQNVIRPNEWERTWANGSYARLRVLNGMRAMFLTLCAVYFVGAGALEWERTYTPVRLVLGNVAFLGLFAWHAFDQLFWRLHFYRKRAILGALGITPERR